MQLWRKSQPVKESSGVFGGSSAPAGNLTMKKVSGIHIPSVHGDVTLSEIKEFALPNNNMSEAMRSWKFSNLANIERGLRNIVIAKENDIPTFWGTLWAKRITEDGEEIDYGIVSLRVVTTAGVNYIAGTTMAGTSQTWGFKYHGLGTGTTAEATADTDLVTELTTQYNPNSTRATGTQTTNGSNVYETVATNTIDSGTPAITEHGIFNNATVGAGTLLDRSVFAAVNLVANDGLQTTYDLTMAAGS